MAVRFTYFIIAAVFTIVLIIIARTVMFSHHPTASVPCLSSDLDYINVDETITKRFQKAITFETVSYNVGNYSREELYRFLQFILKGK